MSLSINKLMNSITEMADNNKNEEGTLYNPDISDGISERSQGGRQ